MTKRIYLFCERNNISGTVNEVAYSSKIKAMKEYERTRDYRIGMPVNFISEETMDVDNLPIRGMIDKLLAHCYVGDKNGNTHYKSYYVISKMVF